MAHSSTSTISAAEAVSADGVSLNLCECCTMLLANDDDSGCRDFHGHTHGALRVPAGTALVNHTPLTHESLTPMTCDGHGGDITVMAPYWIAVTPERPARADETADSSWRVAWAIDQDAPSAVQAAAAVWREYFGRSHASPDDACVFEVTGPDGTPLTIDLSAHAGM